MHDAIVVGGGPAGAITALLLARRGANVCIVERSAFPRVKACGEYLSPGSVALLDDLGFASALAEHARPIDAIRLHGHGLHVPIQLPRPGWSLPRSVLDDVLLRAACDSGAQLLRARVEDCVRVADRVAVNARLPDGESRTIEGRIVVGADGAHSIVARKCGLARAVPARGRFALGGHYDGFAQLDGSIDMFVDGTSYLAINPLGEHRANVMLIVAARELRGAGRDVEAFVRMRIARICGARFEDARLASCRIAIGPLAYRAQRLCSPGVLLVGDAARFVDPFTGQGVYLALRSARIAADAIVAQTTHRYEAVLRSELDERERLARRVALLLRSPLLAAAAARVMRMRRSPMRRLVERVVGAA